MNKKDIAEIRKNFADENGFFTMNRVLTAYIDADKNITCSENRLYVIMPQEECELIMAALKKTLSGSAGKNILEYRFPNCEYEDGGAQKLLYDVLQSKLENDELNNELLKKIAEKIDYPSTFAVFVAYCQYSIMVKDKNNEEHDDDISREFNFIVTAFCPVEVPEDSLIYDDSENKIRKNASGERIIAKAPLDGFVYPVFSDNAADINSVLYYTSKPKTPNTSVVEDILGCVFTMSALEEKQTFHRVLGEVCGSELDYTVITAVNEKIRDEINEHSADPDMPVIDDIKLKSILTDVGVSEKKLEKVGEIYREKVGEKPLTATNLVEPKTVVATPEITINISKTATEKVRTSVIGGRRCLVIDLDDPSIIINGLETTLEDKNSQLATSGV